MDVHTEYQPGYSYRINEYSVAHIYAVVPGPAFNDRPIIGCVVTDYRLGNGATYDPSTWHTNGQYSQRDGVDLGGPLDLPALPCEPIGPIPGWGVAPQPAPTADEIAAKVCEKLAALRIAPAPAMIVADVADTTSYMSGRRAGRSGLRIELREYVNQRFQKGSTDTNGEREKGALDELGRLQGYMERLAEIERQQAAQAKPRVAAE